MQNNSELRHDYQKMNESFNSTKSNLSMLRLLLPFIKPYYKKAILILTLLPLGSFAYSVQPTIIQKAIDGPIGSFANFSSLEYFVKAIGPYVLSLIFAIIINFYIQINMLYAINQLGQQMVADIRTKLFEHLESLPMAFFDRTPVGRNVTRITNDMEQLADSFAGGLILTMVDIVNAFGVICFMFYLNLSLTLAVIFLLTPMYFIAKYFQNEFRKSNLIARSELSRMNSFLQQSVVGIDVLQALNASKKTMFKFGEINKKYFIAMDRTIRSDSSFSASIELISIIAIAVLIFLSKQILLSGVLISIGVIIAFLQYTQTLFDPIRNLSDRFAIIQAGFTAAERISQLLDEPVTIVDLDNDKAVHLLDLANQHGANFPTIEFKNVYFSYSQSEVNDSLQLDSKLFELSHDGNNKFNWILEDFNLLIKPNESLGIVGSSGSGKSSLIKLLTRLYEPQKGEILINGINIKKIPQDELRTFVSVVHQDTYIFSGDLRSNIVLGRNNSDLDLATVPIQILKDHSIELSTLLGQRASNISSGEEQVINFARALVARPKVLILDEATAKIDLKTEKLLLEALMAYKNSNNCSLIAIAHRVETLADYDRVITIT